jgi:hypothetical protein
MPSSRTPSETEDPSSGPADPDTGIRHALDTLDGLDDLPLADHVASFEQVHDELRAHLNGDAGR